MSRHRRGHRYLGKTLFCGIGAVLVITLVWGDLSLREFTGELGAAAFCLLLYRVIGDWGKVPSVSKFLGILLCWSLGIGAVWPYELDRAGIPAKNLIYLTIVNRVCVVLFCVFWDLFGERTD